MYKSFKRICDFFFALLLIIVLSPLLIPIVILLRITDEGEIFYLQERVGKNNKLFNIYKFATMLKDSANLGAGGITVKNDFRVTKMGKFLRKSKINELPQLLNVLFGDMSFVGPRPLLEKTIDAYPDEYKYEVYKVKPGITGIGSIIFRDEEKYFTNSDMDPHDFYDTYISPYKAEVEIWYGKNISLFLDVKIVFATALAILLPNSEFYRKWFASLPPLPEMLQQKKD